MRGVTRISKDQGLFIALGWILLSSIIFSIPNYAATDRLSHMRNESTVLEENDTLASENAPVLRYYLRKYMTSSQILTNFTLKALVEDNDGIDAVSMMYSQKKGDSDNVSLMTQDIGPWLNVSMEHTSEDWYEATILISNLSLPYSWCSYLVKYVANDTLGNLIVSPLCIYTFENNPFTGDYFGQLYETPDLWYVIGSTGHTVTWSALNTQPGCPYALSEDGHLIERWRWTGSMTIDVDGLDLGVHVFELTLLVAFSSGRNRDIVEVHVVETPEEIPFGASTGSVGPQTETESTASNATLALLAPVLVIGISLVAVITIWKKRRS